MLILQLHYFNQQWKYLMLINLDNLIHEHIVLHVDSAVTLF